MALAAVLHEWSVLLTRTDVTAAEVAAAIGEPAESTGTQLPVRPHDPAWAGAEVISRPGEPAPALVRVVPADPTALRVADLDKELGPPATQPPKVHFWDPVSRIYEIDSGAPEFTAAVIAELPPEGGEHVTAVTLRRDIRLE